MIAVHLFMFFLQVLVVDDESAVTVCPIPEPQEFSCIELPGSTYNTSNVQ